MAHHVLGDEHVVVDLAVVDLELEPDEVGQDGRRARLRADGGDFLAGCRALDREAGGIVLAKGKTNGRLD